MNVRALYLMLMNEAKQLGMGLGRKAKGAKPHKWGLRPSRSNPGYYRINIPNLKVLAKLGKAFPDMLASKWLAQHIVDNNGAKETIGLKFYKDGDDRWPGWAWWEDEHDGLEIFIRRTFDPPQLEFEITPRKGYARWTTTKPIKGKRTYRDIVAKSEGAWALKRYLDQL